jgi:thiamine-monophosphate kinase
MKRARGAPRRLDEARAVALFQRYFAAPRSRGLALGIGDDAALIAGPRGLLVASVDASVEGTHFRRALVPLEDIGFRSFQAAVSDLGAMGARPLAALSALTLPKGFSERELERLAGGQAEAARGTRCPIVGGNVARGRELSITTTVLGEVKRALSRSGAKPGDECWLVGDVGLAAAGFALLERGVATRGDEALERCVRAWRRPQALLARGLGLVGCAHAAVDVSDGLGGDAARVATASRCRLVLEERALRRVLSPALFRAATALGEDPLGLALGGGEDYALVAAGPARRRPRWARRIGRFEAGQGAELESSDGSRAPLGAGYDHFTR